MESPTIQSPDRATVDPSPNGLLPPFSGLGCGLFSPSRGLRPWLYAAGPSGLFLTRRRGRGIPSRKTRTACRKRTQAAEPLSGLQRMGAPPRALWRLADLRSASWSFPAPCGVLRRAVESRGTSRRSREAHRLSRRSVEISDAPWNLPAAHRIQESLIEFFRGSRSFAARHGIFRGSTELFGGPPNLLRHVGDLYGVR